jgi:hypothetical protein
VPVNLALSGYIDFAQAQAAADDICAYVSGAQVADQTLAVSFPLARSVADRINLGLTSMLGSDTAAATLLQKRLDEMKLIVKSRQSSAPLAAGAHETYEFASLSGFNVDWLEDDSTSLVKTTAPALASGGTPTADLNGQSFFGDITTAVSGDPLLLIDATGDLVASVVKITRNTSTIHALVGTLGGTTADGAVALYSGLPVGMINVVLDVDEFSTVRNAAALAATDFSLYDNANNDEIHTYATTPRGAAQQVLDGGPTIGEVSSFFSLGPDAAGGPGVQFIYIGMVDDHHRFVANANITNNGALWLRYFPAACGAFAAGLAWRHIVRVTLGMANPAVPIYSGLMDVLASATVPPTPAGLHALIEFDKIDNFFNTLQQYRRHMIDSHGWFRP